MKICVESERHKILRHSYNKYNMLIREATKEGEIGRNEMCIVVNEEPARETHS